MAPSADLLDLFSAFLRSTPLPGFATWITTTKLNALINSNIWTAPVVQTTHILAVGAVMGSVLMICLKIFQLAGKGRSMDQTLARYTPWIWWSLVLLLTTGLILLIGEPPRELLNPAFWTKMILVAVAALTCLGFQSSVRRHADRWTASPQGTLAVRAGAVGIIVLTCLIVVLGRWIAYTPT